MLVGLNHNSYSMNQRQSFKFKGFNEAEVQKLMKTSPLKLREKLSKPNSGISMDDLKEAAKRMLADRKKTGESNFGLWQGLKNMFIKD